MANQATDPTGPGIPRRVLLVDQSDDSRDVLRTALERRGVQIYEAPTVRSGLEMLRVHRPDVVVLDSEADAADDANLRAAYEDELASHRAEMVILGNLQRDPWASDKRLLVRKPYHYGPLVQMIEQLVGQCAARGLEPTP